MKIAGVHVVEWCLHLVSVLFFGYSMCCFVFSQRNPKCNRTFVFTHPIEVLSFESLPQCQFREWRP